MDKDTKYWCLGMAIDITKEWAKSAAGTLAKTTPDHVLDLNYKKLKELREDADKQ
jgi:hypothetical protein